MRAKHYSLRTEKTYIHWIKRYILSNGKQHPSLLRSDAVERFLKYSRSNEESLQALKIRRFRRCCFCTSKSCRLIYPGWVKSFEPNDLVDFRVY